MRINAINSTNFKGLFTNKSTNDNWRMEYSPYSWEQNNTSKMAPKKQFSIYSMTLPDNEEIFTKDNLYYEKESSKDILGTESYFKNTETGKIRKTITEVPAMNREDSLRVLNKKLAKFLGMKEEEISLIRNDVEIIKPSTVKSEDRFRKFYSDAEEGYFSRDYSLSTSHGIMKEEFDNVKNNVVSLYNKFNNYVQLRDSVDNVKKQISLNESEINQLKKLRVSNQLIDISRRDIYDPNKALWEALQDIRKAANKFVCLPHKLISMDEILKSLGRAVKKEDIPQEAIKFVDTLIKKSI